MADEIRPTSIPPARRVRPMAREDREENEERFQKKLAEFAGAGEQKDEETPGERHRDSERTAEDKRTEADRHVGRHLDVET